MWAQVSFVLSQSTRLTDRWIDGQKGLDNTVRNALGYMQWHGKNDGLEWRHIVKSDIRVWDVNVKLAVQRAESKWSRLDLYKKYL